MTILAHLQRAIGRTDSTATTHRDRRARCRNCGRYYAAASDSCPHCGSGNRLLAGPPNCDHDRA